MRSDTSNGFAQTAQRYAVAHKTRPTSRRGLAPGPVEAIEENQIATSLCRLQGGINPIDGFGSALSNHGMRRQRYV